MPEHGTCAMNTPLSISWVYSMGQGGLHGWLKLIREPVGCISPRLRITRCESDDGIHNSNEIVRVAASTIGHMHVPHALIPDKLGDFLRHIARSPISNDTVQRFFLHVADHLSRRIPKRSGIFRVKPLPTIITRTSSVDIWRGSPFHKLRNCTLECDRHLSSSRTLQAPRRAILRVAWPWSHRPTLRAIGETSTNL